MIQIDNNATPWQAACEIINATCTITEKKVINGKFVDVECEEPVFSDVDLIKLGKHLISYADTEMCVDEE